MFELFNRTITTDTVHIGFGSAGKGGNEAHKKRGSFCQELKRAGINYEPFSYMSPETAARKKNALSAREFRAVESEIAKLITEFVTGSVHARDQLATGGGTGTFGIKSIPITCKNTEYTTATVFLSQEPIQRSVALDVRLRKYINTMAQVTLLDQVIGKHQCAVELISMLACIQCFGNSYESVDANVHDIMSIFNGIPHFSHYDSEDILSDPRFKVRTFGYAQIPIVRRFEPNVSRIYSAINQLKPLFDTQYFFKNSDSNVMGSPVVILAGQPELVEDAQTKFGSANDDIFSLSDIERNYNSVTIANSQPTFISCPIENTSTIYIVGIYPIDAEWFGNQCKGARETILDLHRKSVNGQVNSMLGRVYKSMLSQADYPNIEEFIGG